MKRYRLYDEKDRRFEGLLALNKINHQDAMENYVDWCIKEGKLINIK